MMLWSQEEAYQEEPFGKESELERAVVELVDPLFGSQRIYLDVKKLIGRKGKTQNVPDGYLIDLASKKEPRLFVVENELARHHSLKHIAVQILEFSLSFETAPRKVKGILKDALKARPDALSRCEHYAVAYGFENVDVLLDRIVHGEDAFNALVIIDDLDDELETVLQSRFQFPVETLVIKRYVNRKGTRVYQFEPFLLEPVDVSSESGPEPLDPSEIDTIVVPARSEGFEDVFLGENRWYQIRLSSSMISRIKFIAGYQTAPVSAVTHIAPVASIERWKNTNKYVVNFSDRATEIRPVPLKAKGRVKAPQAPRYGSKARLESAKTLDDAF